MTHTPAAPLSRPTLFLMVVLIALGVFFRFAGSEGKHFWFDEIYSVVWATAQDPASLFTGLEDRELTAEQVRNTLRPSPDNELSSVVEAVIRDDPQHGPLFFLGLNLWVRAMGDSLASMRGFSAFFGVLTLPMLYWLCMELTRSRRTACLAVLLVSLSPFHLVYAQEIRQYTAWVMWTALSSAVLLWSLRKGGAWRWSTYVFLLTAGLYTHLLFLTVVASHGAFILGSYLLGDSKQRVVVTTRALLVYSVSTLLGLLLFSPWVWVILEHLSTAVSRLSWSAQDVGMTRLVGMWAFNYSTVFFDSGLLLKYDADRGWLPYASMLLGALSLVPAMIAVLFHVRRFTTSTSLFILPLTVIPFLALAIPDLVLGGMRSGGGNRFLAPSYLGLQLALACWLSAGMAISMPAIKKNLMRAITASYLVLGVISGIIFLQSGTWWNKTIGHFDLQVAKHLNAEPPSLLVIGYWSTLISLGHALDEDMRMLKPTDIAQVEFMDTERTVYLLNPDESRLPQIERLSGKKLQLLDDRTDLYRVDPR